MIELHQENRIRTLTNHHNLEAASKFLGLPEVRLGSLLDAGVVSGRRPGPGGKWRIHIGEVDRLFDSLKAVRIEKEISTEVCLTLNQVLRFYWAEGPRELAASASSRDLRAGTRRPTIDQAGGHLPPRSRPHHSGDE